MNKFKFLCLAPFLFACGSAYEEEPKKPQTACHEFGEAPDVTTIRSPHGSPQLHPDCVKLDELSPLGQDVYCCMGDDFKKWYSYYGS